MTVPHFPRCLLRERAHSWNLRGVATTPGQTANSVAPIIRSDGGGFWTCSMTDVSLSGGRGRVGRAGVKLSTLLWRALAALADGGVNALIVPRNDALFRPWPAGVATVRDPISHSDGSLLGDGTGYYQPVIDVRADGAALLRATRINIEIKKCGALNGGEAFSIDHGGEIGWRLYVIGQVFYSDATHATITFLPPLRAAIASGDRLEFDRPCCTMRLNNPSSMDLTVQPWTFNTASAEFVEAFPPPATESGADPYVVQDV